MHMPVMDGYEATATIRQWEQDKGRSRVPILAVSASTMEGQPESVVQSMDGSVMKPINFVDLGEKLRRLVKPRVRK
jgi:CheY-like chemotaxis protein